MDLLLFLKVNGGLLERIYNNLALSMKIFHSNCYTRCREGTESPSSKRCKFHPVRVLLVDGMSLAYRAFFAFQERPLRNAEGFNTSVLFGFLTTLLEVMEDFVPTHVGIAWDSPEPTFRESELAAYKAHREPPPEELTESLPPLRSLLEAMNLYQAAVPGYEADDLIAFWTEGASSHPELEAIWILSTDKDLAQLVNDRVTLYRPARGRAPAEKLTPDGVRSKFGVEPHQIPDYLALVGDSSDNLPGVKGIGDKTARDLLNRYGSLEGIYRHLPLLSKAAAQRLSEGKALAEATYALAHLGNREVPGVPFVPLLFQVRPPTLEKLQPLLDRYSLRQISKRLRDLWPESFTRPPAHAYTTYDYQLISSPEALQSFLHAHAQIPAMALDVETTHTHPIWAELVGLALAPAPGKAVFIPVSADTWPTYREILRPWAESPTLKIAHNLKYDFVVLANHGLTLQSPFFDTLLADYLLDAERPHNLSAVSERFLGLAKKLSYDSLFEGLRTRDIRQVPIERLTPYACQDADLALRLYQPLSEALKNSNLWDLYASLELPLLGVLAEMELTGIFVDRTALEKLGQTWDAELETLTQKAHAMVGHSFNLNSPQQVAQVLFTDLGLPVQRKTPKGQPATDEETLSALAPRHPLPELLLTYREIHKLRYTYISSLIESIHFRTGRVHTLFQQTVAATGRLSSQNPNLQNIPIRTERGKLLRKAFTTDKPGYVLLSADYSQIELRIAAALSGDVQMIQDFLTGRDIHNATAERLFGTTDITPEMRRIAKTVNFGIIYGITAHGLAERLGHISRTEAQKLIDQYFARYPGVKAYIDAQIARVRETGYAETLLGRRRHIPNIHSSNKTLRAEAERLAINTPIQGTAADLIKLAMIQLHEAHLPAEVRLLLQIHDELLWEVPASLVSEVAPLIAKIMTKALTLPHQVPIEVEVQFGPNWLEMEPISISQAS